MTFKAQRGLAVLLATALIAGCGSDSNTAPNLNQPLDLTVALSQALNGGVNSVPDATNLSSRPTTVGFPSVVPSACTYSSASTAFVCPRVSTAGLNFDISYYLSDAAGHSQSQVDVNSTASVRTVADASGTVAVPSGAAAGTVIGLTEHTDMTLSGLLTTSRMLNGTSAARFDVTGSLPGLPDIHSTISDTTVTSNVVLPAGTNAASSYPSSGTITSDTHSATGPLSVTVRSVITFNGTSHPTIVVSIGGVSKTCTLDLSGQRAPNCL